MVIQSLLEWLMVCFLSFKDVIKKLKGEELFTKEIISQIEQLLQTSHLGITQLPASGARLHTAGDLLLLAAEYNLLAAEYNLAAMLNRLLDPQAYAHLLQHTNAKSESLLHIAAKFGHMDAVDALLRSARCAGEELANMLIEMRSRGGNTALHEAVRAKKLPVAMRIANERVSMISVVNDEGKSPLYLAVEMGFPEGVTMMLEIDPAGSGQCGPGRKSLLHAAIISDSTGITKTLLDKTPSLVTENDNKGQTPLHYATLYGKLEQVKFLLSMDRSAVYALDNKGRSPLHLAAIHGYRKIVQEIYITCPDSAKFLDGRGRNILHLAIENESMSVIRYIIDQDKLSFLLNEKDDFGDSPMHLAVRKNIKHFSTIYKYISLCFPQFDKGLMNNKGQTVLDIAESNTDNRSLTSDQKIQTIVFLKFMGVPHGEFEQDDGHDGCSSSLTHHPVTHPVTDENDPEETSIKKSYKSRANTLSLLATLIATVTFAAAFTMPGGYNSNGQPVLAKQWTFKVFLVADAIAMTISVFVAACQIEVLAAKDRYLPLTVTYCGQLTNVAIWAMIVAFVTGIYPMVAGTSKFLPIFICALPPTLYIGSYVLLLKKLVREETYLTMHSFE